MNRSEQLAKPKSQTTLFCFTAGRLARYHLETHKPLLNDVFGEMAYEDKRDAEAFGRFVCTSPEARHKSIAIIHVTFDASLKAELERSGLLKDGSLNILGTPGVFLSPGACSRLNESARFFLEEIVLETTETDGAQAPKLPEWAEKCGTRPN
jgi:hypothetical protein